MMRLLKWRGSPACRRAWEGHHTGAWLLAALLLVAMAPAQGSELSAGNKYWYVPEHENTGRTVFYSTPSFNAHSVPMPNRTQVFTMVGANKGWALLDFGPGRRAYVHLRVLRSLQHDPAAADPWSEFKRASVFSDDPNLLQAALNRRGAPAGSESEAAGTTRKLWQPKTFGKAASPTESGSGGVTRSPVVSSTERRTRTPNPLLAEPEPPPPSATAPDASLPPTADAPPR